jgi:hypothetical protein
LTIDRSTWLRPASQHFRMTAPEQRRTGAVLRLENKRLPREFISRNPDA